jgi:adenylate cyclase
MLDEGETLVDSPEAAAHVLEHDPAFTISAFIDRRSQANEKPLIKGLRRAGLPE